MSDQGIQTVGMFAGQTLPVLGDLARLANEAHRKAEGAAVSALEYARDAGEHLSNAKAQCRHGEWLPWLETNFEGSQQTANNYMRVAQFWDRLNYQRVGNLTLRGAIAELAEPRQPPDSAPIFDATDDEPDATFADEPEPYEPDAYAPAETVDEPYVTIPLPERFTERPEAPTYEPVDTEPAPATYEVRPHVAHNSGNNEWYTPPEYLEAARRVMGAIDLDPASSDFANRNVQAAIYFTAEDDGLTRAWGGRVFLNPPYSGDLVGRFATKTLQELAAGTVTEAILLVNNGTETAWFQALAAQAQAVCFPKGRIRYLDATGEQKQSPLQGQAFMYFGSNHEEFGAVFSEFGVVL